MTATIARLVLLLALALAGAAPGPALAAGTTYYVSSSTGSDANPGTSEAAPLASLARVNGLALAPGDRVLLRCGDTWRGEGLYIRRSGAAGSPITIGAYPAGCAERPVISGALPVSGWAPHAANIFVADLRAGANGARFPHGVNQLFRGETRLPFGRWPNRDGADGGYTTIEAQPAAAQIRDDQLPDVDWTGAVAHIKGMRWYILNRQVTARAGATLTLNSAITCYANGCAGWGFWLSNHLATLDQEGEWYYDGAAGRLYLFSAQGAPADGAIEASAIPPTEGQAATDGREWGAITLGENLKAPPAFITVENLAVVRWWKNGIATPTNYAGSEAHDLTIRNNLIRDVDGSGISLATWVFSASDGRADGWRGGYNLEVSGNTIERANRYGVFLYSRDSRFTGNTLRDIALIGNLGAAGMGCATNAGEGGCTQDGTGFMVYAGNPDDSGSRNLFAANRLERIGYNGFLVFSFGNTVRNNVIKEACLSKGDCAGVRPFGDLGKSPNPVRDMLIEGNVILDTLGATDGTHPTYRPLFAFGLNADYATNVTMRNNVVARTSSLGILYKESSGAVEGNLLYDNGYVTGGGAQISVGASSRVSLSGNTAFALNPAARTASIGGAASLTASDNNRFFHPFQVRHMAIGNQTRTLAEWRTATGKDGASAEAWYTQTVGQPPRSALFVNDSGEAKVVSLGSMIYVGLDQKAVGGSLALAPYTAQVLVLMGEAALTPPSGTFATAESPAVGFTLKNTGAEALAVTAVEVSAGFEQSHTCPASLAAGASCTITVRFTGGGGPTHGTLTVRHDRGEPYTAALLGSPLMLYLPLAR